jgi:hypothetical protein
LLANYAEVFLKPLLEARGKQGYWSAPPFGTLQ